MNLIPKVAEMLGLEVGEEFGIISFDGVYKFVDYGLLKKRDNECGWEITGDLRGLITGEYEVKKLPFEPKKGETYYFVWFYSPTCAVKTMSTIWGGSGTDYQNKYCGNRFRTKEEAEKHKYEVCERLTGEQWEKQGE